MRFKPATELLLLLVAIRQADTPGAKRWLPTAMRNAGDRTIIARALANHSRSDLAALASQMGLLEPSDIRGAHRMLVTAGGQSGRPDEVAKWAALSEVADTQDSPVDLENHDHGARYASN